MAQISKVAYSDLFATCRSGIFGDRWRLLPWLYCMGPG